MVKSNCFPYYPQALKLVLTRETVGKLDADFSIRIEKYVKRDMKSRLELDKDIINDIGMLQDLQGLAFHTECCPVEHLGYSKGHSSFYGCAFYCYQ